MTAWIDELFGTELLTRNGARSSHDVLRGKKYVGIYFGAQWCPPCKAFNPDLVDFYENVKRIDDDLLEIIFISSDSDQTAFTKYYSEMPWVALPYHQPGLRDDLIIHYEMSGIPKLIVLSGVDGTTKDLDARTTILAAESDVTSVLKQWANGL